MFKFNKISLTELLHKALFSKSKPKPQVDYTSDRIKVSKLIIDIINNKIPTRVALLNFPKDCEDSTIQAVWHALCYLEADSDLRSQDDLYKQEQDDYIVSIAEILGRGEALPKNIIDEYTKYNGKVALNVSNNSKGIFHKLTRFLNI